MDNSQINLLNSFIGGIQALSQELKIIKNEVHNFSNQFPFNYKI